MQQFDQISWVCAVFRNWCWSCT